MKRSVEMVLGVIGVLLYGLIAALGGFMIWLQGNRDFFEETLETADPNAGIATEDLDALLTSVGSGGWMLLIASILAIVLGIAAMILLKGNKQPKAAGIIFLVTAVVGAFVTLGFGIIPGIFYLIAGIMCLVRKPARTIEA